MAKNEQRTQKELKHDFLADKKWFMAFIGFSETRDIKYRLYMGLLYVLHTSVLAMSVAAGHLSSEWSLKVHCVHPFLLTTFAFWCLTARIITYKQLNNARRTLQSGIFYYENEEEDDTVIDMKIKTVEEIRSTNNIATCILFFAAIFSLILFPISQVYLLDEEVADDEMINPYLPEPIYIPFNTRTVIGYIAGYIIHLQHVLYGYVCASAINQIYLSCILQFKVQLQILCYSLKNIGTRAIAMYTRIYHQPQTLSFSELCKKKEFQNCMVKCLRANVLHHLTLLRFLQQFHPFIGICLLASAIGASITYATLLYLIMLQPPINFMATYFVTLIGELSYVFFLCVVGEVIIKESNNVNESLYATPWYLCDKRFNRMIDIIMSCTRKPIMIRALILDFVASLETYGNMISAIYKIANLVRQGDQV